MSAQILDGRALARELRTELQRHAADFARERGRAAHLALLAVGEDAGALVFGQQVMRACRAVGVAYSVANFSVGVSEAAIRAQVAHASNDPATDGVVVLLPLPGDVRQRVITEVLAPSKDVDGLGPRNAGNLLLGYPSFVPGTAEAVMALLGHIGYAIRGKHAVIVGRSNV
ncbi:MAG: bifunctional 5,10-methylenetetrahydrofolate dehydrogenase/5,10-methenyltetrahydrofolate cyclohydrolase, partial [Ktedonobacterales bacterium]|nr:bifunctional 5,10-methylenetetrahydrofolate dehydrogenase/5,10-methenyltetrahydrofolate cyclohydrolase [Ktedonobacterales bacterium]